MIAILSCVWGRPQLTELFCKQLRRLYETYGMMPLIVGSEPSARKMAKEYGLLYLNHENKPLGNKFNTGMIALNKFKPEAVMVLGSDDFISDSYVIRIREELKKGIDLIGTTDCYFYSLTLKQLGYWKGYTGARTGESIGLGRTLSRKILNRCQWQPWISRYNKGLDGSMMATILRYRPIQKKISLANSGIFNVDIKGANNITPFGCYKGMLKIISKETLTRLPEGEQILAL